MKILPSRIVERRQQLNLTQKELNDIMCQLTQGSGGSTKSFSISRIENGKIGVPPKYEEPLCLALHASKAYLCGLTDDPSMEEVDLCGEDQVESADKVEIKQIEDLIKYDGIPLFVRFNDLSYSDGWGIYDRLSGNMIFKNIRVTGCKLMNCNCDFFRENPMDCIRDERGPRIWGINDLLVEDRVFVTTYGRNTSYDGVYHHTEDKTSLINGRGLTLPYTGLRVAYDAFKW